MTLADRIADFLSGTGRPLTVPEIAKHVRAREIDVLNELRTNDRFYGPLRVPGRSPRAKGYLNAPQSWEDSGAPKGAAA